jgi:hypothetical protein
MGVRVKEDGESESRLVMRRIGVALTGDTAGKLTVDPQKRDKLLSPQD